jgi:hypothetical protein
MKIGACALVTALLLLSPLPPNAQAAKPSAHGNIDFDPGDGIVRSVHFNAKVDNSGMTDGGMTFTDPAAAVETDPDNPPTSEGPTHQVTIGVVFDCMIVENNRAVMGGPIVESTDPSILGRRTLLTVEDNGEGSKAPPDKIGWGVYATQGRDWVPTDAELGDGDVCDEMLCGEKTWTATDAERTDDVGILVGLPLTQTQAITCDSFPLSSYALVELDHHDGNIQVKQ